MRLLTNKTKWNDVTFREMVAAKLMGGMHPNQAVELTDSLIARLNETAHAVEAGDEMQRNSIPLQRTETRTPAPPPKTRKRVVFEECDKADWKGDAMGRWWYQPKGTVKIFYSTYELPAEKGIVYFNRTEETITIPPPEPERWKGKASVMHGRDHYARVLLLPGMATFSLRNLKTPEAAAADLPIAKELAEDYARRHNAIIEWEVRS